MNLSLILIPVDFSDCAAHGVAYAKKLTEKFNAECILIHVIDEAIARQISQYCKETLDKTKERLINQAHQAMRAFIDRNDAKSIVKDTIVSFGTPFQEISIKARELQVDLILMGGYGSRGKGQLSEIFFGSTVEKVVRLLPCPVLCVPYGWGEES
ncbi:Universal stress protein UspA [Dissulfuribacter thermophilus]|uniref:Universal stress protein UspA n=1 Tax=Dissulfuribacter thermophilus TaxID=1156395 RepID=A0A1B9F338_9BACT|nr:universal stress protein [Dissulfuribacter thermophilus]OCC14283.1 Universal stress protein UspA [Dissulfuribacter thermophilus]